MPHDKDQAFSAQQMAVLKLSQEKKYVEYYSKMTREQNTLFKELSEKSSDDAEKVLFLHC